MSRKATGEKGFLERAVPLKWVLLTLALMVIVMAAIVLTVLLVDRSKDSTRRAAVVTTTSTMSVGTSSTGDLTELPAGTDLGSLGGASFISVFLVDESGTPTSYGINSDRPEAQALTDAIENAEEVAAGTATPAVGGSTAADDNAASTIIFVFPTRDTLTFNLDLARGIITRGNQAWRPDGDLRALLEAPVARSD